MARKTKSYSVEAAREMEDDMISVSTEVPSTGGLPSRFRTMSSPFLKLVTDHVIERREIDDDGRRELVEDQRGHNHENDLKTTKGAFLNCGDPVWSNLFPERASQRLKKFCRSKSNANGLETTAEMVAHGSESNSTAVGAVHERLSGSKFPRKQVINGGNPCERVYRRRQRSLRDLSLHDDICTSLPKGGVGSPSNALTSVGTKAGETGLSVNSTQLKVGRKAKVLPSDRSTDQRHSRLKWTPKDVSVMVPADESFHSADMVPAPGLRRQSTLDQFWKQPPVTLACAGFVSNVPKEVQPVEIFVDGVSKHDGTSGKSKRKMVGADRSSAEPPAKGYAFPVIPLDNEALPKKRLKGGIRFSHLVSSDQLSEKIIAEVGKGGGDGLLSSPKVHLKKRSRQRTVPQVHVYSIPDSLQPAAAAKKAKCAGGSIRNNLVMKLTGEEQVSRTRRDGRPDERFKHIGPVCAFAPSRLSTPFDQLPVVEDERGAPQEECALKVEPKHASGFRKDGKPDERFKIKKVSAVTDSVAQPCCPTPCLLNQGKVRSVDKVGETSAPQARKIVVSAKKSTKLEPRVISKEMVVGAHEFAGPLEGTQLNQNCLRTKYKPIFETAVEKHQGPVLIADDSTDYKCCDEGVEAGIDSKVVVIESSHVNVEETKRRKQLREVTKKVSTGSERNIALVITKSGKKDHHRVELENGVEKQVTNLSVAVGHGKKLPEVQKNGVRKPKRVQLKRLFVDNPEPPPPPLVNKVTSSRVVKSLWSPPKQMKHIAESGPLDPSFASKPVKSTKFLSLQQLDAQVKQEKCSPSQVMLVKENSDQMCASDDTISDCPPPAIKKVPQYKPVVTDDICKPLNEQKVRKRSLQRSTVVSSKKQQNAKISATNELTATGPAKKCQTNLREANPGVRLTPRTRKLTDAMQNFLLQKATLLQQWKEMELGKIHPSALIGRSCKIFWPLDSEWYPGVIHEYNPQTRKHRIDYEDDEREWVLLGKERVKLYVSAEESKALEISFGEGSHLGETKKLDADELAVLAAGIEDYGGELSHGDLVWAKVKGYPMWPAFVMDEEHAIISGLEPASRERTVPVQFFGSYDHARISGKKVMQFSKGIMHKYHTKCKRTVFEQGLQEVERYLKECKLPESMMILQEEVSDISREKRDGAMNPGESEEDADLGKDEKASVVKESTDIPSSMPLRFGTLQIVSLGKIVRDSEQFHNEHHIWTEGYSAIRKFTSIKDPQKLVEYKMEIERNPTMRSLPLFRVSPEDGKPVEGPSASACWKRILIKIRRVKEKAGLCEATLLEKKRQSFRSGPSLFGFGNRRVARLIQALPYARVCSKFTAWIKKPLLEDGAEEPLPAGYRPVEFRWMHLDRCSVCYLDEEYADNQLLQCDKCRIMVHMYCYGELEAPDGDLWLCNLCRPGAPKSTPFCCLCPVTGGAMKTTTDGRWAHITCAMWTPETCLVDVKRMEPVDGISAINKERWKLVCTVCKVPYGACIQCSKPHCRVSFHPLCARASGLSMEVMEDKAGIIADNDSGLQLLTYCKKHKPAAQGGCIKPLSQQNVAVARIVPTDCPPPSSSGCARGEPYNSALRRGHREPEALAAAVRKRSFVQNMPYIVTGCMRHRAHRDLKGFGGSLWSRHWKQSRLSNALPTEAPLDEGETHSGKTVLSSSERFRHMKSTLHERLTFGKSAIHGWGVFTKRAHCAGDMVIEYAGEIVRPIIADIRERRSYDSLVGAGTYMFRIDDERVVDATHAGSIAHLINHSCEPNCYSRVVAASGEDHIIIFAKRDIREGEELTYDYRFASKDELLTCYCGCAGCRGWVNSFGSEEEPTKITAPRSELTKWIV